MICQCGIIMSQDISISIVKDTPSPQKSLMLSFYSHTTSMKPLPSPRHLITTICSLYLEFWQLKNYDINGII